jgi:hypothetical protein
MPEDHNGRRLGRKHVLPLVWSLSIASLVVVALGITGTFSGFTASIDNNANSAGTGSVIMVETSGATTCYSNGATAGAAISTNSNTCSINKLGGNLLMVPGNTSSVNVTIQNAGSTGVGSGFTITPGGCTVANGSGGGPYGNDTAGFCGKVQLAIWDSSDNVCIVGPNGANSNGTCIPSSANTLTSLGTTPINLLAAAGGSVAAGVSKNYIVKTSIDATATNADMALQVSDDLTWTFTA